MAKHINVDHKEQEGKETVEFFKDLDQDALRAEGFLERNSKLLIGIFSALVLAVLGYFAYQQFVIEPKNEEALKGYLAAQKSLATGDQAKALGGKSVANPGFLGVSTKYDGTTVGKLSAYNAGLIKFQEGKYSEAYNLLDQFSSKNDILMALKYGAMADAKSGMNQNDEALSLLEKAVSASDDAYTQYYFTRKSGMLALALNKRDVAKKHFATIDEKYQDYDNGLSDAYIEMTKYF